MGNAARAILKRHRQLVRSNTCLKSLSWHGPSCSQSKLDANDFGAMKRLQVLELANWSSTPEEMVRLLRLIAGALKELKLNRVDGVRPREGEQADTFAERLSVLFTSQPSEDMMHGSNHFADPTSNNGSNILVLERLEALVLIDKASIDLFLAELVKYCPPLKSLDITQDGNNNSQLAGNLRSHCPHLQELKITPAAPLCCVVPMVRHSSMTGLGKLTLEDCSSDDLIAAVSLQVGTLVDLRLGTKDLHVEICHYIRLLAACPNLEMFALSADTFTRGTVEWDTLMSENGSDGSDNVGDGYPWKCRRLRSLELKVMTFSSRTEILQEDRDLLKEMSDVKAVMDWYRPRQTAIDMSARAIFMNHTAHRKMFELLRGLDYLETLVLDKVLYRSSAAPI